MKTSVFEAEVVFVEGHLAESGGAAAVRAGRVAEGLLVPHVLGAQLFILRTQRAVLMPLMLILIHANRKREKKNCMMQIMNRKSKS